MDISKIRKDVKKISEGVWVGDIPGGGNLRLKVRGMSAPSVREFRAQLERAVGVEHRLRDGSIKPEKSMEILGQTLYERVLLDWDGLTENGKPVKYDKALAKKWLTDPEFEAFGDAVVWSAHYVDRSRAEDDKESVGN